MHTAVLAGGIMNHITESVFICRNEDFHRWIERRLQGCWGKIDEAMAANFIREYCRVTSRSELKTNIEAQKRFDSLINEFRHDRAIATLHDRLGMPA